MTSKEALENIRDYHDETIIDNYCTYTENIFEKELDTIEKDLDRLEEYRKIEKEHGIDLITLFKALKGIWVKSTNGDVYYVGSPYLCFSENEKRELEFQFRVGDTWYKVKDYGNTYALTKEELENDID